MMCPFFNLSVKSLIETILFMLIFICIIFKTSSFDPEGRGGHVAVIINSRIYFIGGSRMIPKESPIKSSIRGYNLSNEIFFLDLASSFSTTSPLYVDLPEMSYGSEKGTAVFGGPTKNDVYLVGGVFQNLTLLNQIDHNVTITLNQTLMLNELLNTWNVTDKHIFIYRPTTKNWIIPDVQGEKPPIRRRSTSTVIDQNGKIYMFGGRAQIDTGSLTFICFNDLYTYDTSISKWNKINAEKAPLPQSHSTATLLPNGKILYIGGVYQNSPGEVALQIDMNNISVFDTNSLTWSYTIATLSIPIQARVGHTATLTPDNNKIIIIGGTTSYVLGQTTAYPVFVSLDITTEPYTYSELNVSGVQPPPLAYHTVTPYQNYMIVAFGNITNDIRSSVETNQHIYLLDIKMSCMIWVNTFTPGKSMCGLSYTKFILIMTFVAIIVMTGIVIYYVYRYRNAGFFANTCITPYRIFLFLTLLITLYIVSIILLWFFYPPQKAMFAYTI